MPVAGVQAAAEADYEAIFSGRLCRGVAPALTSARPTARTVIRGVKQDGVRRDFHHAVVRLVEKMDLQLMDTSSESGYGSDQDSLNSLANMILGGHPPPIPRRGARSRAAEKKSVRFDSYVMLLQGLRERNLELVQAHLREVCDEALATEEVVAEFLSAVIEGNEPLIRAMLVSGFNANATDPVGMTPLHLASTFNYLPIVRLLLSHGAAIFARTHTSGKVPSEVGTTTLPGYQACHAYLRCMEECLGVANCRQVHATRTFQTNRCDELAIAYGDALTVIRKGDYPGSSWWWCQNGRGQQGYVLRDLVALNKPTASFGR
jgi:hypothetical protein